MSQESGDGAGGAVVASGVRAGGPAPSPGTGSPVGRISIGAAEGEWVGKQDTTNAGELEAGSKAHKQTSVKVAEVEGEDVEERDEQG